MPSCGYKGALELTEAVREQSGNLFLKGTKLLGAAKGEHGSTPMEIMCKSDEYSLVRLVTVVCIGAGRSGLLPLPVHHPTGTIRRLFEVSKRASL